MMIRSPAFLLAAVALSLPLAARAADPAAGQAKVKEVCQACHGLDGNSQTPDYPKLAGQYPD
jgi:cytochrome c553